MVAQLKMCMSENSQNGSKVTSVGLGNGDVFLFWVITVPFYHNISRAKHCLHSKNQLDLLTRHKIGHFGDVPQANLLAQYGKT